MSGIGIISQEYENTANLFKALNQSIILLKKHHFQLKSAENITEQQLLSARRAIASILEQIIAQLSEKNLLDEVENEVTQIPPFFIKRLQEQHKGNLEWYVDDLQELQQNISDAQPLTDEFIARLDDLCEQLDAETTRLYRKLWRR